MPQIRLKEVPDKIYQFILKSQAELKIEKKTSQYSLEKTIYKLLNELEELKSKKKSSSI